MPLHDWADGPDWDGMHLVWQNQLLDWIQPRLPPEYRAYLGSIPGLTIGTPNGRPDLGVREWHRDSPPLPPTESEVGAEEPDDESVATLTLDPDRALHIDRHGQLIAAVELISPRNKDRPDARERSTRRYAGYIYQGVHLLMIDVLPRPAKFSFADAVAAEAGVKLPACPVPFAVSFRVGEPVPEGTVVAFWRRTLTIGQPLTSIPLALSVQQSVPIDLESTYREAARRVYRD